MSKIDILYSNNTVLVAKMGQNAKMPLSRKPSLETRFRARRPALHRCRRVKLFKIHTLGFIGFSLKSPL